MSTTGCEAPADARRTRYRYRSVTPSSAENAETLWQSVKKAIFSG
jgi:hypothetical protein